MLCAGERRGRVELEEAEPADDIEHVGGGAVERLCVHRDAPRLWKAEGDGTHRVRSIATAAGARAGAGGRVRERGRSDSSARGSGLRRRRRRSACARGAALPTRHARGARAGPG